MTTATALATDLLYALDPAPAHDGLWPGRPIRGKRPCCAPRRRANSCSAAAKVAKVAPPPVWHCIPRCMRRGALILLLSPSLRQSQELFKKVQECYRALGHPAPLHAESALRYEMTNGSRIIALPGTESNIRGYSSVDVLVVDEAARVRTSCTMRSGRCSPSRRAAWSA